jgi:hypothetical protein
MSPRMNRRSALEALVGLGLVAAGAGCRTRASDPADAPSPSLPPETGNGHAADAPYSDDVDALCDVLLPAERDAGGKVVSVGAREAGVAEVLRVASFVPLAQAQGLLPPLPDTVMRRLADLNGGFRDALNAALAAAALLQRPLTTFRELPRALQEAAVDQAWNDPAQRPALLVVRAACMTAYLGAVVNDLGLRDVGFPPFESFADGLAVSGYPRTKSGRLVDAATENLQQLDAAGDLDDYTYNREPAPTPGDDLSRILDAAGDLL